MVKPISRWGTWLVRCIFMVSDAIFILIIFRLAYILRNYSSPLFNFQTIGWQNIFSLAQMGLIFGLIIFIMEGLYPGYGMTSVKELERMAKSISLVFFFLAGMSYFIKPFQDLSRSILILSWVMSLIILPLVHFILRNILSRFPFYGIPVIVFGEVKLSQHTVESLNRIRRIGWRPIEISPLKSINIGIREKSQVDVAILVVSPKMTVEKYARILNKEFRKVILVRERDNLGSVWVRAVDIEGQLGLEYQYNLFYGLAVGIKRLMDFGLGLIISLLLTPIILLICLLVAVDSKGPIFFLQERMGKGKKIFSIIKFRTMSVAAEQKLDTLLENDPVAKEEYQKYHKLTNDPRLTRVGKFLRRFSLDELPQIFNILSGSMSIVGPRAYMPSELDEMGDYSPVILRIHPGLTGWWQVMGRHETTFHQRLLMDEYYISNWSLWMDIYILMKTIWIVLAGRGA